MKKVNLTPELESFLRREKCLAKFKANVNLPSTETISSIGSAFVWNETIEGGVFWSKLSQKFNKEQK